MQRSLEYFRDKANIGSLGRSIENGGDADQDIFSAFQSPNRKNISNYGSPKEEKSMSRIRFPLIVSLILLTLVLSACRGASPTTAASEPPAAPAQATAAPEKVV